MKKYIFYIASLLLISSCSLDTLPSGDTVTGDQKEDVVSKDPTKFESEVNAMSSNLIAYNIIGGANHYDFGYAAACIFLDSSGADYYSEDIGYNWFRSAQLYRDRLASSGTTNFLWTLFYKNIKQANDVLNISLEGIETAANANQKELFELYAGQAYAFRAFSYLNLVQIYQFTYKGHESSPAVPLVLSDGDERAVQGRASVQAVYDVILDDLGKSIELLDGKIRQSKDMISSEVAYGLRARANLVMQNWSAAASDAVKAQGTYKPYSLDEVSVPAFNTVMSNSWIWGNIISVENDIVRTGIINWPSHVCSFTGNGYTGVGALRRINKFLWNEIPESDVRKHWWVDQDLKAPFVDDILITVDGEKVPLAVGLDWLPYTNIKFGAYENKILNPTNASDWVLMRVEEMILIEAEAKAMSGDLQGGKTVLKNFITQYRDPSYEMSQASSQEEFQDEVWFQRRIELWGEGFSLFDVLRLKKPIVRAKINGKDIDSSYGSTSTINLEPEAPILLYLIPEKEIEANAELTPADNNPTIPAPKPLG